jgi:hypothetical protein
MRTSPIHQSQGDGYRRSGTVRRALTLAPIVPSQDVCRYQATDMPPPTYDLDREEPSRLVRAILVPALAIAATGGAIVLIQRIGIWLAP